MEDYIVQAENITVYDSRDNDIIVKGVSFRLKKGECLGIVGESGSGKSMTTKSLLGLNKSWIHTKGKFLYMGKDYSEASAKERRKLCGKNVSVVMQSGMSSFDPSCQIRVHYREALKANLGYDKKKADEVMIEAMKAVMLIEPEEILKKYPYQLSGGILQRCMIALTLVIQPELIVADEPTTALDVISQYEVLEQFIGLRKKIGSSMIFISHDLAIVRKLADYIIIMKDGEVIEEGDTETIFCNPQHEYTKFLITAKKSLSDHFQNMMGGTYASD